MEGKKLKNRKIISINELPQTRQFHSCEPTLFQFVKFNSQKIKELDERIQHISNEMPSDFTRKPRSIKHYKMWKATEFRMFLLYTGPIILQGILDTDLYNNFLHFHVAISILSTSTVKENIDYANQLLVKFVQQIEKLYGETFLVYNIHLLIHVARDASKFESFEDLSAFCFENNLGQLKKLIRSPSKVLQQIKNRLIELEFYEELETKFKEGVQTQWSSGPEFKSYKKYYKTCHMEKYSFKVNKRDNVVMTVDKKFFIIKNFAQNKTSIEAIGYYLFSPIAVYTTPINSFALNICKFHINNIEDKLDIIAINNTIKKCSSFILDSHYFVIPMLH